MDVVIKHLNMIKAGRGGGGIFIPHHPDSQLLRCITSMTTFMLLLYYKRDRKPKENVKKQFILFCFQVATYVVLYPLQGSHQIQKALVTCSQKWLV